MDANLRTSPQHVSHLHQFSKLRPGLRSMLLPLSGHLLLLLLLLLSVTRAQGAVLFSTGIQANSGSVIQTITIPVVTSGTVSGLRVLTQGIANADFVLDAAGTCGVGTTFTGPTSCSMSVTFQPKAPGERRGAVILLDTSGSVLASVSLYGLATGAVGVFNPATLVTVAGNGQWLFAGDGGPATNSPIFLPGGVAVDPAGNIFISDTGNNRIRRVDALTGVISTVAGTGSPGSGGDGGVATGASVSSPGALLLDGAGDLYIADSANHAIRKLTLATGKLTTVAGQLNQQGYTGDGLSATSATLNTPEGLALDPFGNLYIADTKNQVIRKVDGSTGLMSTYAGTTQPAFSGDGGLATSAALNTPWGLATDAGGSVYIADLNNNRIRKISPAGIITTVVGDGTGSFALDGQSGTATSIGNPAAVNVDVAGNLYVADSGHNVVRKLNNVTGLMTTIAGSSGSTFAGDKGPATTASLYGPYALTLDSGGNLYVADMFHHRIREVQNAQATLAFKPMRVGRTSAPLPQTVENDGNSSLNWGVFAPDSNSAVSTTSSTCNVSTPLDVGISCILGVEFFPQVTGSNVTAAIQLQSDAVNTPGTITISGEVDELEPSQTSISSSSNPSALGASVTFTAQVSGDSGQPTGNIRFYDGTVLLGTVATDSSGTGTFAITSLALGSHSVTANFTGDALDAPSTSTAITQVVKRSPTVNLVSSANPSQVGANITLTATVLAIGAQTTGTVIFSDGSTPLATVSLNASGVATFALTSLTSGTHSLNAAYSGDTNTLAGSSLALNQVVNKWASTVTIGSSSITSVVGTPVVLSFTVIPTSSVVPSGFLVFRDGPTTLATLALDANGAATYTSSSLPVGTHNFTASFEGDGTNAPSDSLPLQEAVQQITTVTTVATSANPAIGGATLHLTANVIPSTTNATAGTLHGTVLFKEGVSVLGTGTLSATGAFTLDIKTLTVGVHNLTVVYSGDTNYAGSNSAALSQQVVLATTSVQLTSSANPNIAGHAITLTSVVSGDGAVPSGSINFLEGTTNLGSTTINASGQASLVLSSLPAGTHPITASFGGDAADKPSVSPILTEVVDQATTAITLTSNSNPAIAGTSVTFVATLSSNGSVPSGQLLLKDSGVTIGNAVLGLTGAAQFKLSSLAPGSHNLTATFDGDTDHLASSSVVVVQVVQLASSTAALSSSQNPGVFGAAIVLTARVTGAGVQPTGNVLFLDGTTALASATLTNGTATFSTPSLSIGSHTITITYVGDPTHAASPPASLIERIQQSTTTSLISSGSPSIVGGAVTFTAAVKGGSGNAVAGSVSFYDGATLLATTPLDGAGIAIFQTSSLVAGTHLVSASYGGDDADRTSQSASLSQAVNTADTSVTLLSSLNPSVVGSAVTFTATVTSRGQAATGKVTFLDGSLVLGTATVTNGTASFGTSSLLAGLHAISARYEGDRGTQVSNSSVLFQVAQQPTSVSLVSNLNPTLTDQPITLTGTVLTGSNPGGTLTFSDGSVVLGTASVNTGGQASLSVPSLAAGGHLLSVQYGGDTYNLPSVSPSLTEVVQLRPTTTSMTASSQNYLDGQQVTLVAVVHFNGPVPPTGTVSFTANGQTLGTNSVVSAGAATLTFQPSSASYDIVATYSGDNIYSGSTADTYTITKGSSTSFSITTDPSAFSLKSGDHRTLTINLADTGNFSDMLSLGCLDLPADATCTFSVNQMKLSAGGVATLQVVFDTGHPLGSGASESARLARRSPRSTVAAQVLYPVALLCGLLFALARRGRRLSPLLSILVLVLAGLTVTGCGNSLNTSTTPAGSFNVRIIATGSQSGISQIANVAVTVQ